MKIGIIGAGTVGQSLARAVLPLGHEVMLSSRDPYSEKMQQLAAETGAQVGTVGHTIAFGDVLAIALNWSAIPDVVGQGDWSGKVVMDMTNRFDGGSGLSAAEDLAQMLPGAQVVKALNTIGAEHYTNPQFDGQSATMFIAGDSESAKKTVAELITHMGFDVVDTGNLSTAAHLEALAGLWVHLAFRTGMGRDVAFKLIKR